MFSSRFVMREDSPYTFSYFSHAGAVVAFSAYLIECVLFAGISAIRECRTFFFCIFMPFLVHLSRRLKCTIVIMLCPSSVRRSSSVVVNFSHIQLTSKTVEQNSMKLERKQDLNVLYQVCVFQADRKNKIAALASDWRRHFGLLL